MGILQSLIVKGLESLNLFMMVVVYKKCIYCPLKKLVIRAELKQEIVEVKNAEGGLGIQKTMQLSHQL
jgi:hypothetical protein